MEDDSFFDEGEDPGPLSEDLWKIRTPDPVGEVSVSPTKEHEWMFLGHAPAGVSYQCRRCSLKITCSSFEDPNECDDPYESCTDMLLRGTHES
jgi:hypothetical protein